MKLARLFTIAGMLLIPSTGISSDETLPNMELLEFLGSFETARGKQVDPLTFADSTAKDIKNEVQVVPKKDNKRNRKSDTQQQKERDNEK